MMRNLVWIVAAALLAGACSGGDDAPSPRAGAEATPAPGSITLPSQLLGLKVVAEDISKDLKKVRQVYFDRLALFSFRETDDLLRGTLQVAHFGAEARPEQSSFRSRVVAKLGSQQPRQLKVGDTTVYLTGANQQSIFVWFVGRDFYALSVRSDYPFTRTLLRRLLDQSTAEAA